ncbi:hypothetical protein EB061_12815, partial [bacterium]|nr:hypothetical protein [bacterium]
ADPALTAEACDRTRLSLLAFLGRQGSGFSEFTRRMIALSYGLRHFADRLKPALLSKDLRVSLWPETGFFLQLQPRDLIGNRSDADCRTWVEAFALRSGLGLTPGSLFGTPDRVQLCYAAPHPLLSEAAQRLTEGFASNPGYSKSFP